MAAQDKTDVTGVIFIEFRGDKATVKKMEGHLPPGTQQHVQELMGWLGSQRSDSEPRGNVTDDPGDGRSSNELGETEAPTQIISQPDAQSRPGVLHEDAGGASNPPTPTVRNFPPHMHGHPGASDTDSSLTSGPHAGYMKMDQGGHVDPDAGLEHPISEDLDLEGDDSGVGDPENEGELSDVPVGGEDGRIHPEHRTDPEEDPTSHVDPQLQAALEELDEKARALKEEAHEAASRHDHERIHEIHEEYRKLKAEFMELAKQSGEEEDPDERVRPEHFGEGEPPGGMPPEEEPPENEELGKPSAGLPRNSIPARSVEKSGNERSTKSDLDGWRWWLLDVEKSARFGSTPVRHSAKHHSDHSGGPRAGHKYIRRWYDLKSHRWRYEYTDEKEERHGAGKEAIHAAAHGIPHTIESHPGIASGEVTTPLRKKKKIKDAAHAYRVTIQAWNDGIWGLKKDPSRVTWVDTDQHGHHHVMRQHHNKTYEVMHHPAGSQAPEDSHAMEMGDNHRQTLRGYVEHHHLHADEKVESQRDSDGKPWLSLRPDTRKRAGKSADGWTIHESKRNAKDFHGGGWDGVFLQSREQADRVVAFMVAFEEAHNKGESGPVFQDLGKDDSEHGPMTLPGKLERGALHYEAEFGTDTIRVSGSHGGDVVSAKVLRLRPKVSDEELGAYLDSEEFKSIVGAAIGRAGLANVVRHNGSKLTPHQRKHLESVARSKAIELMSMEYVERKSAVWPRGFVPGSGWWNGYLANHLANTGNGGGAFLEELTSTATTKDVDGVAQAPSGSADAALASEFHGMDDVLDTLRDIHGIQDNETLIDKLMSDFGEAFDSKQEMMDFLKEQLLAKKAMSQLGRLSELVKSLEEAASQGVIERDDLEDDSVYQKAVSFLVRAQHARILSRVVDNVAQDLWEHDFLSSVAKSVATHDRDVLLDRVAEHGRVYAQEFGCSDGEAREHMLSSFSRFRSNHLFKGCCQMVMAAEWGGEESIALVALGRDSITRGLLELGSSATEPSA